MQIFASDRKFGFEDRTYQAVGGLDGLIELVDQFYSAMDTLPQAQSIRSMHDDDLTLSKQKLVYFLSGWMGGPQIYREKFGSINIPRDHVHLKIDESARDAWLLCMQHAMDKLGYEDDLKQYLSEQFFHPAERIRCVSQYQHRDFD